MVFMKVFSIEAKAEQFARTVGGRVVVRYDWDLMRGEMVREFIVKW